MMHRTTFALLFGWLSLLTASEPTEPELPLQQLRETTLLATRSERELMKTPGSITSINYDTFAREGVNNAGDVARYQTGISIPFEFSGGDSLVPYRGSGFTNYRMRGVEGNRVLLMIDGIRQPAQIDGAGGNGRDYFDPGIFERVEILRGSGSSLYGSDAMGGVVSFETRSLEEELEASERPWLLNNRLGYQSANNEFSHVLNAGLREGPWYVALSNALRSGEETENDKGEIAANPLDSWSNHLLGKISYHMDEAQQLTFTAEHFNREQDTDLDSLKSNGDGVSSLQTVLAETIADDSRTRYSIEYQDSNAHALWDQLSVKLYYQYSETNTETNTQTRFANILSRDRTDDIQFAQSALGLATQFTKEYQSFGMEHSFIYGIESSTENAQNSFTRTDRALGGSDPVERPAFDEADLRRYDLFFQNLTTKDRWLFQAGLRLGYYEILPANSDDFLNQTNAPEASSDYSKFSISPSASIQYELNDATVLWARYAKGIRNPSAEDYVGFFNHSATGAYFNQIPNPNLEEETSDSFDLGIKYASESLELELTTYYTLYDGFISLETIGQEAGPPVTEIQQARNIGEVEIYGIDLRADYQLGAISDAFSGYSTGLNLSWADGHNKTTDDNVNTVDPFEAVLHFGYDSIDSETPWGLRLYGTYRAEKKDTTRDYAYYVPPASFVLDLTGYWSLSENISLNFGLRNLTDERYWIWSSSSSTDHESLTSEYSVQPGLNGFLSLNIKL
ncbi:TonB-dependent hemoglobin/transferrin/lactoferrin family receptor [Coraliomargarita sp. SDUM461004]|uniref:TonB-dependent hemoglobin/transferrin/lactoferrin family receptor n=1 Tax=Thalassobacterium sedimentorum TaxID=3041258 RepID=A0ABU1AFW1_9BACT|nr:TonB-dependent hemoglobin/transferrin/lactoferrin family receptor [Coraliomargarita sp. SDUM461004]MDQ8193715.1 TonB-dependent hemoglobin/transferrin/lactoferrin family receptor [Coraliomargarita sp. SDUM461004]